MTQFPDLFAALAASFEPDEVKVLTKGGKAIHYITARTVMNRLDVVLGPENWWDDFVPGQDSVICRLTIRLPDGTTITKGDAGGAAGMSDAGDDDKSAFSDAFKRAAVKFGVARYLYRDGVPSFGQEAPQPRREARPEPRRPKPVPNGDGHGPSREEINGAFPARRKELGEFETWAQFVSRKATTEKDRWDNELMLANVPVGERSRPENQLPNQHEVTNHVVSRAIERGIIDGASVEKDGKPGVRDREKAKLAAADLYRRAQTKVREHVESYYREKERELRVRLGMDDPEGAPAGAPHEREPGED